MVGIHSRVCCVHAIAIHADDTVRTRECVAESINLEVVPLERFELPTFWFVAMAAQNLSAFFGVAYELRIPFRPSQLSVDCP